MSTRSRILLAGILLLLPAIPCLAEMPVPPGVEIRADAVPKTAAVGDPIRIDLDITVPAGYQVEMPEPRSTAGDFSILDVPRSPEPVQTGSGTRHQKRIVAAVYKTGIFSFPPVRLHLKTPEGNEIAASTPPLEIEIRSVLTEAQPGLKDLKKQAEIPEGARWGLWISIALTTLALAVSAWFLFRRRRRPEARSNATLPPQDSLAVAERDLRALLARGVPKGIMIKEFYVLLSEITKRILQHGYGVTTSERTTTEIVNSLRGLQDRDSTTVNLVDRFLTRCDLVKFAKYVPSHADHEIASKDALAILESSKSVGSRQPAVGS